MNLNKFGRWSGIVVAVAMLAMVLQGCGGDDNGADQDMRDQLAMLQGDLDAANAAKMEAETAKTMAEEAQAMAETAKMAAEMERDEANVARGVAEAAKMVADQAATDAMAAQATAEMAQAAAETAKTTAETDRDSYKMMAEEANTAKTAADQAKMVADQAAADAMVAQEAAEAAQATAEMERDEANTAKMAADQAAADAMTAKMEAEAERDKYKMMLTDLQGEIDMDDADEMSVEAKALYTVLGQAAVAAGDVPTIMVDIENGMLKATAEGYTSSDAPDEIEGLMGALIEHKDGHFGVVYSDLGSDGGRPLYDLYNFTPPADGKSRSYSIVNDNTNATDRILGWGDVTRPDSTTTGGELPGSSMFMGSVKGVPGTFSCRDDDCAAPARHTDGTVAAGAGMWTFAPDDPNGSVEGADDEYLTFGWWVMKNAAGMPAGYALIVDDEGMSDADNTSTAGGDLRGTATYKGAAAGKYALPSTADDTYEGGHFTAMATIEADFDVDSNSDGENDRNGIALSGMIDNFMTGDVSRDWTVNLMVDGNGGAATPTPLVMDPLTNLDASAGGAFQPDPDGDALLTTEWSMGDGAATVAGTWAATFHHKADSTPGTAMTPDAVTGTFNAMGDIGNLQGAFGANKMME